MDRLSSLEYTGLHTTYIYDDPNCLKLGERRKSLKGMAILLYRFSLEDRVNHPLNHACLGNKALRSYRQYLKNQRRPHGQAAHHDILRER